MMFYHPLVSDQVPLKHRANRRQPPPMKKQPAGHPHLKNPTPEVRLEDGPPLEQRARRLQAPTGSSTKPDFRRQTGPPPRMSPYCRRVNTCADFSQIADLRDKVSFLATWTGRVRLHPGCVDGMFGYLYWPPALPEIPGGR